MASNDHVGRIHKQPFIISIAVLFAICIISTASRLYIRLRIQKQFSIDDVFLIVALCCLTASLGILYSVTMDKMYFVTALLFKVPNTKIPADWLEQTYSFEKWITVALMLSWSAIMAVKFSFLFLLHKLINRIKPLRVYWWIVTIFNVAVLGYGLAVYYLVCPYYGSPEISRCSTASGVARIMRYTVAQTILDVLGDLLILYIPVQIIWTIQVRRSQKAILALSLCLTVVMIMITITRISGIKTKNQVDQVWDAYFTVSAAEIGIILTAVSAFRVLYISRQKREQELREQGNHSNSQKRYLLKRVFTLSIFRSKRSDHSVSTAYNGNTDPSIRDLPGIPRAHMTGARTLINEVGIDTRATQSQVIQEKWDESWPLSVKYQGHGNFV